MIAQSWIPISHKNVCQILLYEDVLLSVYHKALIDQQRCPSEWQTIIDIEVDELKQDLSSMLN